MDNTINNINFKGAFMINTKKMSPALKEGLEKKISNYKKIVYQNVDNNGKDLFVLNDKFDYDFAKFIQLNSISFKYFPEINTSLGFNAHNPAGVLKHIETIRPTKISRTPELMNFVKENRFASRSIKDVHTDKTKIILEALNITTDVKPQKLKGGVVRIVDKDNGKIVNISPKDNYGITYVFTDIRGEDSARYAFGTDGKIICKYNTPDGILKFRERFNNAIKDNLAL